MNAGTSVTCKARLDFVRLSDGAYAHLHSHLASRVTKPTDLNLGFVGAVYPTTDAVVEPRSRPDDARNRVATSKHDIEPSGPPSLREKTWSPSAWSSCGTNAGLATPDAQLMRSGLETLESLDWMDNSYP